SLLRDTLWYARFADGRILGFPLGQSVTDPARTLELPVYFQMDPPSWTRVIDTMSARRRGVLPVQLQRHIGAFAIDSIGNFWLAQYAGEGRHVLAALSQDGATYRAFDIGGRIRALAATDDFVIAIVQSPSTIGPPRARIFGYLNPF